jgi:branched-chain amino acid transport system ATP-binding protein
MELLEIRKVKKDFGGLRAIDDLNLKVGEGEILGLIGPNGAGKTTLFNVIAGFYAPTKGRIIFQGEDIAGLKPNEVARKGLVRTFQATTLFKENTVLESVCLGFHLDRKAGFWGQLLKTPAQRQEEREIKKRAMEILEFMMLDALKDELAKNLPYGHQRALGVSIALATNSKLLLLDEPVCGMTSEETKLMMDHVRRVHEEKRITLIIVEHDMRVVMGLSDRIAVLNYGRKIAEGTPEQIRDNREVVEAYLGIEEK